jgi:phosphoglycerate kinase
VDLDVPVESGRVTQDLKLRAVLPTVRALCECGARVMLASHLGRPRRPSSSFSLEPVGARLAELLDMDVNFIDDCLGDGVRRLATTLKAGQVMLLENLRFHGDDERDDEVFTRGLAQGVDLFVNDALSVCHLPHGSVVGITQHVKERRGGLLLQAELAALERVTHAAPGDLVLVLGGRRLSDKLPIVSHLLARARTVLLGGDLAMTFLKAAGRPVGGAPVEEDRVRLAEQLLKNAADRGQEVVLPVDHVVAPFLGPNAPTSVVEEIPEGHVALDVGPQTSVVFARALLNAQVVAWNGPLGAAETLAGQPGTRAMAETLRDVTRAGGFTVVAGDDTADAVRRLGLQDGLSHVSQGGAAALLFLGGETLPGLAALT